ncbi:hypothetical protein D3C84_489230 [compost metagenome]
MAQQHPLGPHQGEQRQLSLPLDQQIGLFHQGQGASPLRRRTGRGDGGSLRYLPRYRQDGEQGAHAAHRLPAGGLGGLVAARAASTFAHGAAIPRLGGGSVAVLGTIPLGARRLAWILYLRAGRQLDQSLGEGLVLLAGSRPFPAQGGKERLEDEVVNEPRLMETHLVLGGMDVHIHLTGIQLYVEHIGGEAAGGQQLVIGLADGVVDELVAHHAAVHIGILQIVLRSGPRGQRQPAPQAHVAVLALHRQRVVHEGGAADGGEAALLLRHRIGGLVLAHHLAVVAQDQGDVEAGERDAAHQLVDVGKLCLLAAHELAPRRGVEEEVHHLYRGAHRVGRRLDGDAHLAPLRLGLPGFGLLRGAGGEGETGDRADGGERLAAKTEAVDPFQVIQGRHLGGRVS